MVFPPFDQTLWKLILQIFDDQAEFITSFSSGADAAWDFPLVLRCVWNRGRVLNTSTQAWGCLQIRHRIRDMLSICTQCRFISYLLWSASLVDSHWGHVDGGQLIVVLCKSFISQQVVLQDLLGNLPSEVSVVFLAATLARVAPFDAALAAVLLDALAEAVALTVSVQLRLIFMGID